MKIFLAVVLVVMGIVLIRVGLSGSQGSLISTFLGNGTTGAGGAKSGAPSGGASSRKRA